MNKLKKREINQVIDKSCIYVCDKHRSGKKSIDQNWSKIQPNVEPKLNYGKMEK